MFIHYNDNNASVLLQNRTLLHGNIAESANSIQVTGGLIIYRLPAPAGHWLMSGVCRIYREACFSFPCEYGQLDFCLPRISCRLTRTQEACAVDPGAHATCTYAHTMHISCTYAHILSMHIRTDPEEHLIFGVGWCPMATFMQPCPWKSNPDLLGDRMFALPVAPVDGDFPRSCSPGILGSADATLQDGPECAGPCPQGVENSPCGRQRPWTTYAL